MMVSRSVMITAELSAQVARAISDDCDRTFVDQQGRRRCHSLENFFCNTLLPKLRRQFPTLSNLEIYAIALPSYIGPRGRAGSEPLPPPVEACTELLGLFTQFVSPDDSLDRQSQLAVQIGLAYGWRWRRQIRASGPDPDGWNEPWARALQEFAEMTRNFAKHHLFAERNFRSLEQEVRGFEFPVGTEQEIEDFYSLVLDLTMGFVGDGQTVHRDKCLANWDPAAGPFYNWLSLAIMDTGYSAEERRAKKAGPIKTNFVVQGLLYQELKRAGQLVADDVAMQFCLQCGKTVEYCGGTCCGWPTLIRTKMLLLVPSRYGTRIAFWGCAGLSFVGEVVAIDSAAQKVTLRPMDGPLAARGTDEPLTFRVVGKPSLALCGKWHPELKDFCPRMILHVGYAERRVAERDQEAGGQPETALAIGQIEGTQLRIAYKLWGTDTPEFERLQKRIQKGKRLDWDHYFEWSKIREKPSRCPCGCEQTSQVATALSVQLRYGGVQQTGPAAQASGKGQKPQPVVGAPGPRPDEESDETGHDLQELDASGDPVALVEQQERQRAINEVLQSLPAKERNIVGLFLERRDFAEIAEMLACEKSDVRRTVQEFQRRLDEHLKDHD